MDETDPTTLVDNAALVIAGALAELDRQGLEPHETGAALVAAGLAKLDNATNTVAALVVYRIVLEHIIAILTEERDHSAAVLH
jgi:hypothetical protein